MNSRKIDQDKKQIIAITANVTDWIRIDKAAEMLGVTPDAIQNNIYDHVYPEYAYRQSVFTKVWWVWLPAVIGFTADEWRNKTA